MRRLLVLLAACSGGSAGPEVECGSPGLQIQPPSRQLDGCTHVLGSIHIPDQGADALVPLRSVRQIDENLTIFRNVGLANLADLAVLESVGDAFSIRFDGGLLEDLEGVSLLREIGSLELEFNGGLASLRGLERLEDIAGDVRIRNNALLPQAEIDALLARVRVGGTILVEGNAP